MITTLALYLTVGVFAGLIAGLLGIGGGLLIVPCLAIILPYEGVPPEYIMHIAVGTTLAITVFTSLSAIRAHVRQGGILVDVFKQMVIGLLVGAVLGAVVANFIPSHVLKIIFAVFAFLIAARMGFNVQPKPHHQLPGKVGLWISAVILSCASSLVGLAGGVLVVPYLTRCNIAINNAVSTSAACTLPIAFAGGMSFLVIGLFQTGLPAWSLGYVFLPALAGIAVMSMVFAPIGARLSKKLPPDTLKRVFAVFLVLVGINMMFFE